MPFSGMTKDTYCMVVLVNCIHIGLSKDRVGVSEKCFAKVSTSPLGVSTLTSLQKLLGHTTVAMTMHYLRQVTPMEDTVEIMAGALG